MEKNRTPEYVLGSMKNLNMIIILYITGITMHSLWGYVHENSALDFLRKMKHMPLEAWKQPVLSVGLYLCLLLLLSIHSRNNIHFLMKTVVELGIAFGISYALNFSYTGVVLLIVADMMGYFSDIKWRAIYIMVMCVVYMVLDYNFMSVWHDVGSIEVLWGYYNSNAQSVLLGVKNVLGSLNMFAFIIYMVIIILMQISEKEQILSLNEKLNAANSELVLANRKLEEYAKESEKAAAARERNRLAREIHDTLGHSLTGIITGIEACVILMDIAPEATKEQLKAITDVARQGVKDVRRSVKALRPDALESMDLEKAIIQMVDEMRHSTNVDIQYQSNTRLKGFNKDEEDVIYRIVQECITNSIRHGKAGKIWITVEREYGLLKIRLKDNGIGCADIQKGFGLHHMEERLDMLKGELKYSGEDGFTVDALIPIRWGTEEKIEND